MVLPTIAVHHTIILRLPSGAFKLLSIRPESTTFSLGKFGSFNANDLIGHPYGFTYEIQGDKSLKKLTTDNLKKIEEESGNNEFIVDDNQANQVMSHEEIRALRDQGDREALIEKLKQNNKSFDLKTEYSKEKYTARKMAKFAPRFTTIPPTLFDVITYLLDKDPERILNVNQESMGFLLNAADVRPGSHYLVVDNVSGLLVSGLLELGANVTMVHDTEHANVDTIKYFPQFDAERLIEGGRLRTLNWEQASHRDSVVADLDDYIERKSREANAKDKEKIEKRRFTKRVVQEYHETLFDGCIVMSHFQPMAILETLLPRISNSRKVVVYSPYREPLLQLRHATIPELLMPCIKELRAREYQILQGRTRPVMTKRGEWGYVYHAIKVQRADGIIAVGKNQAMRERQLSKKSNENKRENTTNSHETDSNVAHEQIKPLIIHSESTEEVETVLAGTEDRKTDERTVKRVKLSEESQE